MVAQDFCISEEPADKVGERGLHFCHSRLMPVRAGEDALLGTFFSAANFLSSVSAIVSWSVHSSSVETSSKSHGFIAAPVAIKFCLFPFLMMSGPRWIAASSDYLLSLLKSWSQCGK
jgi:hypothetical protein